MGMRPLADLPAPDRSVVAACRLIMEAEETPRLDDLARAVGLPSLQFRRLFESTVGVTPKRFHQACRDARVKDALARGATVTDAFHEAGFGSSGRFYEQAREALGMLPSTYRKGAPNEEIRFAVGDCSLGAILVAATRRGVCWIAFGDDPQGLIDELQGRFPKARLIGNDPAFDATVAIVVGFIEQPAVGLNLPLDIRGTAFQRRVWEALRSIPVGATASYSEIARRIGQPGASRAVARACASNTLALAIPCHRVVRSDGGLSGYRWGVARKQTLLNRERDSS